MNNNINIFYKNHSNIYKVLLFIATTFLIVFLFPKSGRFKYNFEKGKPWQTENLYAPFNFAIKKNKSEIDKEKELLKSQSIAYFNRNEKVKSSVFNAFEKSFSNVFSDSIPNYNILKEKSSQILDEFYEFGILSENIKLKPEKTVIILENNVEKETANFKNLFPARGLAAAIPPF